jgi:c-di-GMP-binding flagellar brake protein YcgR
MTGQDNKRRFNRMMVNSACKLKIVDDVSSRSLRAVCKDISATGMSIDIEEKSVEMGTMVNVYIESTNSQYPSLTADTRVVHCKEVDANSCNVGVEIFVLSK